MLIQMAPRGRKMLTVIQVLEAMAEIMAEQCRVNFGGVNFGRASGAPAARSWREIGGQALFGLHAPFGPIM